MLREPERPGALRSERSIVCFDDASATVKNAALAGVMAVTLIAYLRCLGNGFVFDDRSMIVANPYLGQWSFLWKSMVNDSWWFRDPLHLPQSSYYRPLQDVWLGLEHHLFALDALGWHATMVAQHLVVVWLVFKLAARLTGEWWAALVAAAFFGLIPVQAEAVVWPSAIPHELSVAFELAALLLFAARPGRELRNWTLAMLCYAGALLSHESSAAFPALAGCYVLLIESPDSPLMARVRAACWCIAPFVSIAVLYLIARRLVLGFVVTSPLSPPSPMTYRQAFMMAPLVLVDYVELLMIPWWAGGLHFVPLVNGFKSPDFYLPAALMAGIIGAFLSLTWRSPRRRLYLFCTAWIAVQIAPAMNLRALYQLVHDNYLYAPSIGWCVIVGDVVNRAGRRSVTERWLACGLSAAMLIAYIASLWHVEGLWHDDRTLFTQCVAKYPRWPLCRKLLAGALKDRGDLAGAQKELETWLGLRPLLLPDDGETLYGLGLLHARSGRARDAIAEISEALRLMPHPPAVAYASLAELYDEEGDGGHSAQVLRQLEAMPGGAQAVVLARARILMRHGDSAGAEKLLREVVARYPDDERAWVMLGLLLADGNRNQEAFDAYHHAFRVAPHDPQPHLFAARALHTVGRDGQAREQCRQALAIQPDYAEARALMAQLGSAAPQTVGR